MARWYEKRGASKPQFCGSTTDERFSKFHRALCHQRAFMTDVDALEYRFRYKNGELVLIAILEIKHLSGNDLQKLGTSTLAVRALARRAKLPFYLIFIDDTQGIAHVLAAHLPRRRENGVIKPEFDLPLESNTLVATLIQHSNCRKMSLVALAHWIDTLQEVITP